jgi:hypothetical protein
MGTGLRPVTPRYYSPPCCPPLIASAELVYLGEAKKIRPKKTGRIFVSRRGGTLENMKVNVKRLTSTSKHGMSTIRRGVACNALFTWITDPDTP